MVVAGHMWGIAKGRETPSSSNLHLKTLRIKRAPPSPSRIVVVVEISCGRDRGRGRGRGRSGVKLGCILAHGHGFG